MENDLTNEEKARFEEICLEEGLSVQEMIDKLVQIFLTEGETHPVRKTA